jgi:hypothetical protein
VGRVNSTAKSGDGKSDLFLCGYGFFHRLRGLTTIWTLGLHPCIDKSRIFSLSYTGGVEAIPKMDRRKALRYSIGVMLCWLLLMYAVGAKLALYHMGQPGARSVAATKAWEDHAVPSVDTEAAPVLATTAVINIGAVLLALVFAVVWRIAEDESARIHVRGFSPHLSVRPPPIF